MKEKETIGRIERADFPELGLFDLMVKIDTGAYTSSLHASDIRERKYKGVKHLYYRSLDPEHPVYHGQLHRCAEYLLKEVKSSNGGVETRYVIDTSIMIQGNEYPIALSLSDRSSMKTPVLLGRKFIRNRFVVDVTKVNATRKKTISKKKKRTKEDPLI